MVPGGSPFHVSLSDGRYARFDGHEHLLRVQIEELNQITPRSKHALSNQELAIIAGGKVRIWMDDYQIYMFRFTRLDSALFKLVQVLDRIANFPVPLRHRQDCEALIGRKVYWREIPAVIKYFDREPGIV